MKKVYTRIEKTTFIDNEGKTVLEYTNVDYAILNDTTLNFYNSFEKKEDAIESLRRQNVIEGGKK